MSTPDSTQSWQQLQSAAPAPSVTATVTPTAGQTPQTPAASWQQQQSGTQANNNPAGTPMPATVDPRDAAYYDQLARLNYSYNSTLAGVARGQAQDQAAYTSGAGALTTQLPLTLQATRNTANAQGLLESGILGQRAGANQAGYATKMGALLARLQGQQQTLGDTQQTADANYNLGQATAIDQATARANKNDETNAVDMAAIPVAKTTANSYKPPALYGSVKTAAAARAQSKGVPASHTQPATAAGAAGRAASKGVKATAARIY